MSEFYDQDGNVWSPSINGMTLTRLKKMPKLAKLAQIPGEMGFFAHVEGRVYTAWENRATSKQRINWRILMWLKPVEGRLNLYTRTATLAEVMLETFTGPADVGSTVVHIDGDITNCCIDNLKWRKPELSVHPAVKLADTLDALCLRVRDLVKSGMSKASVIEALPIELRDLISQIYDNASQATGERGFSK